MKGYSGSPKKWGADSTGSDIGWSDADKTDIREILEELGIAH